MDLLVIGAGYVGLTTAAVFAQLGHDVTVHDLDPRRIELLASGRSPIFEPGLEDALAGHLGAGRIRYTIDAEPPPETRVAFVCVPTPMSDRGLLDTSIVEGVVAGLRERMARDSVIAVRSTLPLHGPERLESLVAEGDGAAVVVNPEFMREGHALSDAERPSRIVVGWLRAGDARPARAVVELYEPLGAPSIVADARTVVLIKLASNVFLGAKIAFANEVARLADAIGADVRVVADGLGLDPRIGRAFLESGPGFGGSCLPEQAEAMAIETGVRGLKTPLLSSVGLANEVHQAEIAATVGRLLERELEGARVAVLGLSFKANSDDVRRSPALALAKQLRSSGASVVAYDPVAASNARRVDPALETAASAAEAIAGADVIVVVTEWAEFRALDWTAMATSMRGDLVYDTRRVLDRPSVEAAGLRYVGLGMGLDRARHAAGIS